MIANGSLEIDPLNEYRGFKLGQNNNKIIQRANGKHAIHINDIKEIGDE